MKLFLVGVANILPEHVNIALELKKKHKICYWVRMEKVFPIDADSFPDTIFHDYEDAFNGIPARSMEWGEPVSEKFISFFTDIESELMTMMNKRYETWPIDKRKNLYYKMLSYWYHVLKILKPEYLVFAEVPHQVFTFVIYGLAKHLGIPMIMLEGILKYDRMIAYRDYKIGNGSLIEARKAGFPIRTSLEELSQDVKDYFLEQTGRKDTPPGYINSFKREHHGWRKLVRIARSLWPFVKDGSIFERAAGRFFQIFKSNLKDEYNRLAKAPDLTKPYVYAALHYQPERTTSPQGGVFVDQLLMIRTLSDALPQGWILYVKEHPMQWLPHGGKYTPERYPGYYEEIARLPNVQIVPIDTNTFTLTEHARAVATVTGIPGWEAVLRGVPALIFGYAWFAQAPGIFKVASSKECRQAFDMIQNGYIWPEQEMINYMGYLDRVSFFGYSEPYGQQISTLKGDEQWKYIYEAIEKVLTENVEFKAGMVYSKATF